MNLNQNKDVENTPSKIKKLIEKYPSLNFKSRLVFYIKESSSNIIYIKKKGACVEILSDIEYENYRKKYDYIFDYWYNPIHYEGYAHYMDVIEIYLNDELINVNRSWDSGVDLSEENIVSIIEEWFTPILKEYCEINLLKNILISKLNSSSSEEEYKEIIFNILYNFLKYSFSYIKKYCKENIIFGGYFTKDYIFDSLDLKYEFNLFEELFDKVIYELYPLQRMKNIFLSQKINNYL